MKNLFHMLFVRKVDLISKNTLEACNTPDDWNALDQSTKTGNTPEYHPNHIQVGYAQSTGRVRERNEDAIFSLSSIFSGSDNDISCGVFIVADGMGGHEHGQVASSLACKTAADYLVQKLLTTIYNPKERYIVDSVQEILENAIRRANRAVIDATNGGGTTLSAVVVLGEQAIIAHVGDSRIYFLSSDGKMQQVTQDHTLVQRLLDLGQLTMEESRNHPQKNVLYKAIGQCEIVEPDIRTSQIPNKGWIMVCSDGLWGVIADTEMIRIIRRCNDVTQACEHLVETANRAGGPDNISVILIQC